MFRFKMARKWQKILTLAESGMESLKRVLSPGTISLTVKSHGKPKVQAKYHIELDQFPTICKQMIELKIIIRTTILAYGVCLKFLTNLAQS